LEHYNEKCLINKHINTSQQLMEVFGHMN